MQLQLRSTASAPTLADFKALAVAEINSLDDTYIARNLAFVGSNRQTFLSRSDEAQAFVDAGYTPSDGTGYPLIQQEADIRSVTATVVADDLVAMRVQYDAIVAMAERTRLSGELIINAAADLAHVAQAQFNYRAAMAMSSTMGVTYSEAAAGTDDGLDVFLVDADGVDALTLSNIPTPSLVADMEIVIEAYAPPGDPWRGSYSDTITNPGTSEALTFTIANSYLVTVRNMPRVSQQFIIDCHHRISGATTVTTTVSASAMTYTPA